MSREELSTVAENSFEYVHREPVAFGEPTMFWVDEVQLQKYLEFELERLNKSDKRAADLKRALSEAKRKRKPARKVC